MRKLKKMEKMEKVFMRKKILMSCVFLCLANLLLVGAASGNTAQLAADQAQLSADVMLFNTVNGDFTASGNVIIITEGLTANAPRGSGNVQNREVHFFDGIEVSGDWRGDWLDLSAEQVSLFFAQTPTYIAEGMVNGVLGEIFIDVDKFYMKGEEFAALNVRRLEDREVQIALSANRVDGVVRDGAFANFVAQGRVFIEGQGRPGGGGPVDIRGDRAVYSVERGSVVVSGNVRAVQEGRVLTAGSVVYFPDNNRIDAYGDLHEGRVRITIDIPQREQE